MSKSTWGLDTMQAEISRLLHPGVLGFHEHFEVTCVAGFRDKNPAPVNLFTIYTAQEHEPLNAARSLTILTPDRISIPGLKRWQFGVFRHHLGIQDLHDAITDYAASGQWKIDGKPLATSNLLPAPPRFVPIDSSVDVQLNRVLKNNFWNGSHIFELWDTEKTAIPELLDNPLLLQALTEEIKKIVPIRLSTVSDRIGNILVQLPVTVCAIDIHHLNAQRQIVPTVAWHPKATARPLHIHYEVRHDELVVGYDALEVTSTAGPLHLPTRGGPISRVWDEENRILLAASPDTHWAESFHTTTQIPGGQRHFFVPDKNGHPVAKNVEVTGYSTEQVIGKPTVDHTLRWTSARVYRRDADEKKASKEFVQYGLLNITPDAEHEIALNDLHWLIKRHGRYGTYLWDPYLCAADILKTLFFSPHSNSDIRALTGGAQIPQPNVGAAAQAPTANSDEPLGPPLDWGAEQSIELNLNKGNARNLKLEFRTRRKSNRRGFHDRFIIFPSPNGTKAWSLGTSVNAVGKEHHILQIVTDGQLVHDAFISLWDTLTSPGQLIWKTP